MEPSHKFSASLEGFTKSVRSLQQLLRQQILHLDPVLIDGIKNGCMQKFEYSIEQCWKLMKLFLSLKEINAVGAKESVKLFFEKEYITEALCEKIILMPNDRNAMSHIYNEIFFEKIFSRLSQHTMALEEMIGVFNNLKKGV